MTKPSVEVFNIDGFLVRNRLISPFQVVTYSVKSSEGVALA